MGMTDANHGIENSNEFAAVSRFRAPLIEEFCEQRVCPIVPWRGKRLNKIDSAEFHCQVKPLRVQVLRNSGFVLVTLLIPLPLVANQQRDNRLPLCKAWI